MNEKEVRRTFEVLKKENELIEVRIIQNNQITSGYFKSVDNIISKLPKTGGNVYFVLNSISEACYAREQQERFIRIAKNTTSDSDITNRDWILIDIDPKRPSGVSASDKEKETSKVVANKTYSFLRDVGFTEPVITDSGNGFHMLYKINLENTDENRELIKSFLQVIDMMFSDDKSEIDKSVFNASRIIKLYGTESKKGNSTEDRPHRESKIHRVPKEIKETPIQLIKKVVDMMPKPPARTYSNNYGADRFNLRSFISKHNIKVQSESSFGNGTKFILEHCLFDENHKAKDAAIFELSNGAIGYKCFHNSCSHYKWQDVRKLYEPNAYDRSDRNGFDRVREKKKEVQPQETKNSKGAKFLRLSEIEELDRSQIVSIPSGFRDLDSRIIGFNKGEVTLWSGKNGSAKSTIINQVAINAVEKGFRGIIFSGELQAHKMKNWVYLQCAGRQFTTRSTQYNNYYYLKKSVSQKIDRWLDDKLLIYNNDYGNNFEQLMSDIKEHTEKSKVDFVIIDNLMALDILTLPGDKYQQQTRFVNDICSFAGQKNIHLHIVAHPRKQMGFLRKEDISGTADLTNAVDNVIICHRNNKDYKIAIKEFFDPIYEYELTKATNYIEVCKNRDLGVVDEMIGLYFEVESKRLLNEEFENIVYGWQELGEQTSMQLKRNESFYDQSIEEGDPFYSGKTEITDVPF